MNNTSSVRLSGRQAMWLVVTTILATTLIFLPAWVAAEAKQDAWLSVLLSMVVGVVTAWLVSTLGRRFPDLTIVQYGERILGRVLGKVVGLVYAAFFLHINTVIVREFGELLLTGFMPETPLVVFIGTIIVVAAYGAWAGPEVLARVNDFILPVILFLLGVSLFLLVNQANLAALLPLAEEPAGIVRGALASAVFFSEVIILAMLIPSLNLRSEAARAGVLGVLVAGFSLMAVTVFATMVFGGERVANLTFPYLALTRIVSVRGIVERVEFLALGIWVLGGFVKISVFYYAAALASSQWLGLREYRSTVVPIGLAIGFLSVIQFENIDQISSFLTTAALFAYLPVTLGLPALLLILATLRGLKGGSGTAPGPRGADKEVSP